MCDVHDQETTLGGRAPSPDTFVSLGRIDLTSGSVGVSQESSTRFTEDRDVDDVARGVAVLFPSRSSPRPWAGVCPLPVICKESASEDEDERESVGSRAPGTETDVLSDTPAHGPGRVTTDPSLQDLATASRQLGSTDDVTFVGTGACASGTGDHCDVFLGLSTDDNGSQGCPQMVSGQGATSSLTHLVDDEAKCIICLHGAEDEASVNEDMPSAVRYILETTTRLIHEMGEYVPYPSGMHWLACCHQPIHVTCMIRSFYRMEVSSLSSHVSQWIVGSHREREDRSQSMAARYVPKFGRVCPT